VWYSEFVTAPAKSRRSMLEEFAAANPNDAFARYGLALECVNAGDPAAAEQHFRLLLAAHPEYVPGYYHFGQLLARQSQPAAARKIFSEGIATARKAGDTHSLSELQAALDDLG
jgi:tetratricopeptide (TPR) repeat protein